MSIHPVREQWNTPAMGMQKRSSVVCNTKCNQWGNLVSILRTCSAAHIRGPERIGKDS